MPRSFAHQCAVLPALHAVCSSSPIDCSLPRLSGKDADTARIFAEQFLHKAPVILSDIADDWATARWTEAHWESALANVTLPLRPIRSTVRVGGRFSAKRVNGGDFLRQLREPDRDEEVMVFSTSRRDALLSELKRRGSLSIPDVLRGVQLHTVQSVGGPSHGQGFHQHEETWFALLNGEKEWFLRPPARQPASARQRVGREEVVAERGSLRCVQRSGEILYFPDHWWHATYNREHDGFFTIGVGCQGRTEGPVLPLVADGDAMGLEALVGVKRVSPKLLDTAMMTASVAGHLDVLQWLLNRRANIHSTIGVDVASGSMGLQPLHQAAIHGHLDVVQMLLKQGASLSDAASKTGHPALFDAVDSGHTEVVQFMLESRADVQARDASRRSVMHTVAGAGHSDMLSMLLQARADVASEDARGTQPIHQAAFDGHAAVIADLLQHGVRPAAGWSLLQTAAGAGHSEALAALVVARGDIAAADNHGLQAIHHAAGAGQVSSLLWLLARGAEVEAKNFDGDRPMHMAAANGHVLVLQALHDAGAALRTDGARKATAMDAALAYGHIQVLSWLAQQEQPLPPPEAATKHPHVQAWLRKMAQRASNQEL